MPARDILFPDPPRTFRGRRAVSVGLRTAHIATFGALLGGHLFGVEPERLHPWLLGAVLSGLLLFALEVHGTAAWLTTGKGLTVLAKLLILGGVVLFWAQRVPILFLAVVVASVGAHMPARFRHWQAVSALRIPEAVPDAAEPGE